VVTALLLCFATMSFLGVRDKSATYDEPLHLVGGMVHRYARDFRINPEDPALFGWWATLPHGKDSLSLNTSDAFYEGATTGDTDQQWLFVHDALYVQNAAIARQFLTQSRAMFVLVGAALGAVIAIWAYQIAGPWAAIAAASLYSFDPNFLGHSALVKNDVPLSLMMCLMGFFLWRFGRQGGWHWLILAAVAIGLGLNVKFSAVLFGPVAILLLLVRSILREPWTIGGRKVGGWIWRAGILAAGSVLILVAMYLCTWTVYGFRYSATASGQPLNNAPLVQRAVKNTFLSTTPDDRIATVSPQDVADLVAQRVHDNDIPLPAKVDLWMQQNHILPEGWLYGFLYTYATTLFRSAFLMGSIFESGRWYYFPCCIAFKTPAATLAAMVLIPVLGLLAWRLVKARPAEGKDDETTPDACESHSFFEAIWTLAALLIPPAVYFAAALTTNLNLGLRHVLPVYPFIFIGLGVGMAMLLSRAPAVGGSICGALILGLIVESATAYPNYLAFFNAFCGGTTGGLKLLGDSNLDWGQDLPALAQWQKEHPAQKLYFCYFGMADPRTYGIDFINLPGGWPFSPNSDFTTPGVFAMSATNLQGIYISQPLHDAYLRVIGGQKPFQILNGTIYLYKWPPEKSNQP
jgi:hypothetical protein